MRTEDDNHDDSKQGTNQDNGDTQQEAKAKVHPGPEAHREDWPDLDEVLSDLGAQEGEDTMRTLAEDFRCLSDLGAQEDEKTMRTLAKDLQCPVCQELPRPGAPIYTCSNGHLTCGPCQHTQTLISSCSVCRDRLITRCHAAEKAVKIASKDIQVSCGHKENGCLTTWDLATVESHEELCQYREVQCPAHRHQGNRNWDHHCIWQGPRKELMEHLLKQGCVQIVRGQTNEFEGDIRDFPDVRYGTFTKTKTAFCNNANTTSWKPILFASHEFMPYMIYLTIHRKPSGQWLFLVRSITPRYMEDHIIAECSISTVNKDTPDGHAGLNFRVPVSKHESGQQEVIDAGRAGFTMDPVILATKGGWEQQLFRYKVKLVTYWQERVPREEVLPDHPAHLLNLFLIDEHLTHKSHAFGIAPDGTTPIEGDSQPHIPGMSQYDLRHKPAHFGPVILTDFTRLDPRTIREEKYDFRRRHVAASEDSIEKASLIAIGTNAAAETRRAALPLSPEEDALTSGEGHLKRGLTRTLIMWVEDHPRAEFDDILQMRNDLNDLLEQWTEDHPETASQNGSWDQSEEHFTFRVQYAPEGALEAAFGPPLETKGMVHRQYYYPRTKTVWKDSDWPDLNTVNKAMALPVEPFSDEDDWERINSDNPDGTGTPWVDPATWNQGSPEIQEADLIYHTRYSETTNRSVFTCPVGYYGPRSQTLQYGRMEKEDEQWARKINLWTRIEIYSGGPGCLDIRYQDRVRRHRAFLGASPTSAIIATTYMGVWAQRRSDRERTDTRCLHLAASMNAKAKRCVEIMCGSRWESDLAQTNVELDHLHTLVTKDEATAADAEGWPQEQDGGGYTIPLQAPSAPRQQHSLGGPNG